jgi:NADH-quinone oxidoreductase subunit L
MTMALGASAYSAAIFHLMTHAFFKAVLFLGAGSVIIAMHHEQDMRRMGGLRKYLPITYATVLIGAIANAGFPPFAGFFSKDTIIEALHAAQRPGATIAYLAALSGVFIGALYSFRLVFFAFHGKERFAAHADHDQGHAVVAGHAGHGAHAPADPHAADGTHDDHGHHDGPPRESPWVVTLPLIALSVPAVCAGWLIGPIVFGDYFGGSIQVAPAHVWIPEMAKAFHGVVGMIIHGFTSAPFWLAVAGLATAWYLYILRPDLPGVLRERFGAITRILERKYGFDEFNDWFFAGGARRFGAGLWKIGDVGVIDGFFVNGSARLVGWVSGVIRYFQSGFIYHYAFTMIVGVLVLLTFVFVRT